MTETSILPGAAPSTDAGLDMVPPGPPSDEPEGGNRRRLLILGAIAGVIVLAAAAYMLLHKSSSSPTVASPVTSTGVVHHATPKAPKPPNRKGHAGKGTSLPKKAKHQTVRDPFEALVTLPVQTTGGATSTTTVPAPTTSTGTTPVVTPPTTGTTTKGSGKTAGGPQWIQLTGTHGQTAIFKVGYAHHKFRLFDVDAPKPSSNTGTVFDKIFALIGVQNGQATLQIGDATPFDLTMGVAHVV
jgi:hypothetical protein